VAGRALAARPAVPPPNPAVACLPARHDTLAQNISSHLVQRQQEFSGKSKACCAAATRRHGRRRFDTELRRTLARCRRRFLRSQYRARYCRRLERARRGPDVLHGQRRLFSAIARRSRFIKRNARFNNLDNNGALNFDVNAANRPASGNGPFRRRCQPKTGAANAGARSCRPGAAGTSCVGQVRQSRRFRRPIARKAERGVLATFRPYLGAASQLPAQSLNYKRRKPQSQPQSSFITSFADQIRLKPSPAKELQNNLSKAIPAEAESASSRQWNGWDARAFPPEQTPLMFLAPARLPNRI